MPLTHGRIASLAPSLAERKLCDAQSVGPEKFCDVIISSPMGVEGGCPEVALSGMMKKHDASGPAPSVRFRGRIEINGINPYILVDAKRARKLKPDWRKPLPVRVQING